MLMFLLIIIQWSTVSTLVHAGTIDIPEHWYRHELNEIPHGIVQVNYSVSFPEDKCCPTLYLASTANKSTSFGYVAKECFYYPEFRYDRIVMDNIRYLSAEQKGCVLTEGTVQCHGYVAKVAHEPRNWRIFIGYECEKKQALYYNYTFRVNVSEIHQCRPLLNDHCQRYYNSTTLPNYFGHYTENEADKQFKYLQKLKLFKCHHFMDEGICRLIYPECNAGTLVAVCKKICVEIRDACRDDFSKYNIPNLKCDNYPDSLDPNVCIYKPTVCPQLESLTYGYIRIEQHGNVSIARYNCKKGYHMVGESLRACGYYGKWNGTTPICLEDLNSNWFNTALAFGILLGLLMLIVPILIIFRLEIKVLIYVKMSRNFCCKYWWHSQRRSELEHDIKYDIFICYAEPQREFVLEEMIHKLKCKNSLLRICVHDLDFIPGERITDNIITTVQNSRCVMALVTQSFIDSKWCRFEFQQANNRALNDPNFHLILILMEPLSKISNMPANMQAYINTWTYINGQDENLWEKLMKSAF